MKVPTKNIEFIEVNQKAFFDKKQNLIMHLNALRIQTCKNVKVSDISHVIGLSERLKFISNLKHGGYFSILRPPQSQIV